MSKKGCNYKKMSADLLEAVCAALYHLEVRRDPVGAAIYLRDAKEQALRDYLDACGLIYDGTQDLNFLDTSEES